MSGLLDDIKKYRAAKPECTVGLLLRALDKQDRDDLNAAFADPTVMGSGISAALRNRGHNISDHSLQRHRRGACACADRGGK